MKQKQFDSVFCLRWTSRARCTKMSCIRQRAATTQSPEPLKDKAAKPWLLVERVTCLIESAPRSRPSAMPHEVVFCNLNRLLNIFGVFALRENHQGKGPVAIPAGIWNFIDVA